MPLLPLGNCGTFTPPVDGCHFLFDIGEAILAAALTGLAPYLPDPTSPCAPGVQSYVSVNVPPADNCDVLAVYMTSYGPSQAGLTREARGASCAPSWPEMEAVWQAELWEAAYPTVDEVGGSFSVPDPSVLDQLNRHVYAHGLAAYNGVMGAWYNRTLTLPAPVDRLVFSSLVPLGPEGGCVGWRWQMRATIVS